MLVQLDVDLRRRPSLDGSAVPEEYEFPDRSVQDALPKMLNAGVGGSWDCVMSIVQRFHQDEVGCSPRLVTKIVVFEEGRGHPNGLKQRIPDGRIQLTPVGYTTRCIPVSVHQ